ncbi:MAG: toll/interleukin-1 receptor domain-containing protein [Promethearchaeota archaeon]
MAKKKAHSININGEQFKLLMQSMTITNLKEVINHYNEKYVVNNTKTEKLKGFSSLKKEELIDFIDSAIKDKEKQELYKKFEPNVTKKLVQEALSLISGEHKVEKVQQASITPGGKGYKIWFKSKYGMHETSVEITNDGVERSCDCRLSKLGGICIHQIAIYLMLINKKVITLSNLPFKVTKKTFDPIQKRLDLIATQSLFKEEPAIMLSNGYKIYVNGDIVTYEWTGDFPGKNTRDFSVEDGDVDSWICNKIVEVMLKHIKVKTKEGTPEKIVIDSYSVVEKIIERENLVKKILRKFNALEDPSLPSNNEELEEFLKSDLKESVSVVKMTPPFKAYDGNDPFLFVSYTHKDKPIVYPIIKKLHKNGVKIWYDEGIPLTTDWGDILGQKIIDCDLFVSFISPNVNNSDNTQKEIKYACLKKKPYISIHLEETNLNPGIEMILQDIQGILKYKMDDDTFYSKLIEEINQLLPL